ncbi:cystathionine gamma-synthase [Halogeometricum pallidum JCM 14848]|uniref:Cystathionine gamma-synthase n=1 Tax=Halogeometricum pallidum JCM 14848 TaxID=1227487 RepID=M0D8Q9_HALPD|nr:PLP-dependent aspartate aminotransferase family protein [Halogeometricum pallidum]ELZ31072.1 cystathionine gamma-synthase [Halogeometricum pallidum JCM 14848]
MNDAGGKFETLAVTHGERGQRPAEGVEDVAVPVHLSSTYAVPDIDPDASLETLDPDAGEFLYSRLSNPTRNALEHRLAALCGGEHAFAFASGTAAIVTAISAAVEPGDHVVAFDDLYGGTKSMLSRFFEDRLGVAVTLVDARDTEEVAAAMRPETALIWMESPTNPLLRLCDIEAVAAVADEHGALLGVDNTFVGPYFQRPLELGADVVVHSTTKYLNGHSDSIGGALATNDEAFAEEVTFLQRVGMGNMLAPFDAYLTLRGLKTLPLRMEKHASNARAVAEFLSDHSAVSAVHYPGLDSHPQHGLAARQMSGYGGVLSAELATGLDGAARFVAELDHFPLAVSLGGVESLIEHPATMTHSPLSQSERDFLGITDSLLRISVGVEHESDLLSDLATGLDAL